MDTQALGVELIQDVRCLGCGKVLAGKIENAYERLTQLLMKELNDSLPKQLTPIERDELAVKFVRERNREIFQKLGIKRQCCLINLQYKSQLLVGAPSPVGNTIIDRQNMKAHGIKRSITRIDLSTKSRLPGISSMNMMSYPGPEDYGPEWKKYEEKMRKDLAGPEIDYVKNSTKLISYKSKLPLGFNIKNTNIPIVSMGESKVLDTNFLSLLEAPIFTTDSNVDKMEVEITTGIGSMSMDDQNLELDGNNFRDLMDFEFNTSGVIDTETAF
jgi:DNA-directed RNA polymerase subunit N (RpoN/RPB10)